MKLRPARGCQCASRVAFEAGAMWPGQRVRQRVLPLRASGTGAAGGTGGSGPSGFCAGFCGLVPVVLHSAGPCITQPDRASRFRAGAGRGGHVLSRTAEGGPRPVLHRSAGRASRCRTLPDRVWGRKSGRHPLGAQPRAARRVRTIRPERAPFVNRRCRPVAGCLGRRNRLSPWGAGRPSGTIARAARAA